MCVGGLTLQRGREGRLRAGSLRPFVFHLSPVIVVVVVKKKSQHVLSNIAHQPRDVQEPPVACCVINFQQRVVFAGFKERLNQRWLRDEEGRGSFSSEPCGREG